MLHRTFRRLAVPSLLVISFCLTSLASARDRNVLQPAADRCDWSGSGGGGRGVRPVYLRCSRAVPGLPLAEHSSESDNAILPAAPTFRACMKVSGPVRVYLETNEKLASVYSPRDGKHPASHRCFRATKRPTALYVEAEEGEPSSARVKAKVRYDLEALVVRERSREFDQETECRPCSLEELAEAYCRSDMVARGTIGAVQRRPRLETAELIVRVTKTLRRVEEAEGNDAGFDDTTANAQGTVRVRVPTSCDARHGQGEFVIMAKRRLGDLVLVCAPRLETWAVAVRKLESAPCVLKS
ncbi:hypothetical protein KM043_012371 [Ampulex compressa]|nr:hypothetical protein KM043_012371 [Ampulex compressa]